MPASSDTDRTLVFISHSHADETSASCLCDFLLASLDIEEDAIRCSSVPGHQLPFGTNIAERLKGDLNASTAVIALFTPESVNTGWVTFEMGACWALGKVFVPILAHGVTPANLPGPLGQYPCISIESPNARATIHGAIAQISRELGVPLRHGARLEAKLDAFLEELGKSRSSARKPNIDQAKAFEISWLAISLLLGPRHPEAVFEQVRCYLEDLKIALPQPVRSYIHKNDDGASVMRFLELVGGQIAARSPDLLRFFEGGVNLLIHIKGEDGQRFYDSLRTLELPQELLLLTGDLRGRADAVHSYFAQQLKPAQSKAS